eukprot:TRINITY_DN6287_c0_g1_i2.p1 TRINITY_DN6287_c0_g1~~TRINITY_DN6287_c0_g1_i2.p1  ORF type:complete len:448 (+),score=91.10 TRINITY_DN6287_c0_g1_i2:103-1446(+)
MAVSAMLPDSAFQNNAHAAHAADALAVTTPMSDCQSPLDRWLGLPAKSRHENRQKPTLVPMPEQAPSAAAFAVAMPVLQQGFRPMGAVPPAQQPTWVYFMPVNTPPPMSTAFVANLTGSNEPFCAKDTCAVDDGVQSCSTDVSPEVVSSLGSDEETMVAPVEGVQRLTASQARRKRRQRAAAFARSEQVEQGIAAPGPYPRLLDPASAATLNAEMCARLTEQINSGGESTAAALGSLLRSVRRFCFDSQGCRVLQLAIERGSQADVAKLLKELQGSVVRAATSPHGNFVLQKVIEVMPAACSRFIAEELRGHAVETACNKFGCRILCRLLEHSSSDECTMPLVEEVLSLRAGHLIRDDFGHHVTESILEHGIDAHKQLIFLALEQEMHYNVCNRSALFVLDRAMNQSTPREQRSRLSLALKTAPETAVAMSDAVLAVQIRAIMARAA